MIKPGKKTKLGNNPFGARRNAVKRRNKTKQKRNATRADCAGPGNRSRTFKARDVVLCVDALDKKKEGNKETKRPRPAERAEISSLKKKLKIKGAYLALHLVRKSRRAENICGNPLGNPLGFDPSRRKSDVNCVDKQKNHLDLSQLNWIFF